MLRIPSKHRYMVLSLCIHLPSLPCDEAIFTQPLPYLWQIWAWRNILTKVFPRLSAIDPPGYTLIVRYSIWMHAGMLAFLGCSDDESLNRLSINTALRDSLGRYHVKKDVGAHTTTNQNKTAFWEDLVWTIERQLRRHVKGDFFEVNFFPRSCCLNVSTR